MYVVYKGILKKFFKKTKVNVFHKFFPYLFCRKKQILNGNLPEANCGSLILKMEAQFRRHLTLYQHQKVYIICVVGLT